MFKIIGADQKEYGPVSSDQIRQWIRDGRVNAQTQARLEPDGAWQPLSSFPEFANDFRPATPATPGLPPAPFPAGGSMPNASREAALQTVKTPAICLIVMASLGIATNFFSLVFHLIAHQPNPMFNNQANMPPWVVQYMQMMQGPLAIVFALIGAGLNALVLFGAIKMMRLQSHGLAMVACIVAMLPVGSCCCVLGLVFGIWGLVVINKPEVKSHFT